MYTIHLVCSLLSLKFNVTKIINDFNTFMHTFHTYCAIQIFFKINGWTHLIFSCFLQKFTIFIAFKTTILSYYYTVLFFFHGFFICYCPKKSTENQTNKETNTNTTHIHTNANIRNLIIQNM